MNETNSSRRVLDGPVSLTPGPALLISDLKSRQCAKIVELRQSLTEAGLLSLDAQAAALGLARSTAWVVLKGDYKTSGLSAAIVKRILTSPKLPLSARQIIEEYLEQRLAGAYGHSEQRLRVFRAELACLDRADARVDDCKLMR
jgi:sulfite reductase beta subunit-like hemoprotein